jgi:hypothetical protein
VAAWAGGLHLYEYVRENPVLLVDPLGLWNNTGILVDKNVPYATIVCNGPEGGMRVRLPNNLPPEDVRCYGDCVIVHEESHIKDAITSNPNICKGSLDGIQIGNSSNLEHDASEVAAHTVELECLKRRRMEELQKTSGGGCLRCELSIENRIRHVEGDLGAYKKFLERDQKSQ